MLIEFDEKYIEQVFVKAEEQLLNKLNLYRIQYDDFQIDSFDKLNIALLKEISGESIVYCLWSGDSYETIQPNYIGHAKYTISRQRVRAHLTKKNKATGAQLDKIKECLNNKKVIGFTFLVIKPSYMRKALEDWLINKNISVLRWNVNK
jgi:hypothetical protein